MQQCVELLNEKEKSLNKINVKRLSIMVLSVILLSLLCSCQMTTEQNVVESSLQLPITTEDVESRSTEPDAGDNQLSQFLISDDSFASPIRQYGAEEFININTGSFLAYITYPQGDLQEFDSACKAWVEESLAAYRAEASSGEGELLITYNSYIVDQSYVVVAFNGEFYSPNFAHPISFFKSFNANLNTGKVLQIDNLLEAEELSNLKKYVIESKNLDENFVDEQLLDNFIILDDGIKIILEKGRYTPESEGVVKVFASYDMLKNNDAPIDNNVVVEESVETAPKVLNETEIENLENLKDDVQDISKDELNKNEKVIALTFDDGPGAHTERLLNILKDNNVKATFFVLGSQIDRYPDLLPRMVEDGHEIGGHSWTHRSFKTLSDEELTKEIMQTRAKIASLTGVDALSVRPPYGAYNKHAKAVAKSLGVHFVNWNVDPLDWKTRNAQKTYDSILNSAAQGNIVLSHDIHVSTVDAMERLIPKLLDEGYHFVTVSELLILGKGEIEPGEVYFSMNN